MEMELKTIDINQIIIHKRIREDLGNIDELARSIDEYGLICPILINKNNLLISGLRRIKAVQKLGQSQIKALVVDMEGELVLFNIESQENLCRKPLSRNELDKEIEIKKKYATDRIKRKSVARGLWRRFRSLLKKNRNKK